MQSGDTATIRQIIADPGTMRVHISKALYQNKELLQVSANPGGHKASYCVSIYTQEDSSLLAR